MAENIEDLLAKLTKVTEKIGLYMKDASLGTPDNKLAKETNMEREKILEALKQGNEFVLMAQFVVGELAWTDRVLDPEEFKITQEFRSIVPDTTESKREEIIKRIRKEKGLE